MLADQGFLDLGAMRLEYRMIGPRPDAAPTIMLLHEGLGSVALWRDFPRKLAEASGLPAFVYSRPNYGRSAASAPLPRPVRYMHDEALLLPQVLRAAGISDLALTRSCR